MGVFRPEESEPPPADLASLPCWPLPSIAFAVLVKQAGVMVWRPLMKSDWNQVARTKRSTRQLRAVVCISRLSISPFVLVRFIRSLLRLFAISIHECNEAIDARIASSRPDTAGLSGPLGVSLSSVTAQMPADASSRWTSRWKFHDQCED